MCEFCEKGKIDRTANPHCMAIVPNTNKLVIIFDSFGYQSQGTILINYCPICGRKLDMR